MAYRCIEEAGLANLHRGRFFGSLQAVNIRAFSAHTILWEKFPNSVLNKTEMGMSLCVEGVPSKSILALEQSLSESQFMPT